MILTPKYVPYLTGFLGLLGLIDSGYLVAKQLGDKEIGTCPIFGTGCADVLHSVYSQFLGIPLAYYGILFYGIIITLSILVIVRKQKIFKELLALSSLVGFLMSAVFIYIQGVLIGAYCFYCVLSAINSTLLFFIMLPTLIDKVFDMIDSRNKKED